MTTRTSARRALAATVTAFVALLGGAATASAGVQTTIVAGAPPIATVGQPVPTTLTLVNQNFGAEAPLSNTVTSISLVPACGAAEAVPCPVAAVDPGVLRPRSTGTGRAGTACAGMTFTITLVNLASDEYQFAPSGTVTLTAPGTPTSTCTIDFLMDVLKSPTRDTSAAPGLQTVQVARVAALTGGSLLSQGFGTSQITILKATPALATQVAPQAVTLGAAFTDTAILSAAVAATGTVRFDVFGPDNAACAGAPVLTSTNPVAAGTTATSNPFTPTAPGTYRIVATYSGDANNNPVTTACGDPAEIVTVTAPVSPLPPPLPPPVETLSIRTVASPAIDLGGEITDTATVSGRLSTGVNGTMTFRLFGPDDVACTGAPVFNVSIPIGDATTATSPPFKPTVPGTYRWIASYSYPGNSVSGACNDPGESVVVTRRSSTTITSARFETPPQVGRETILAVTASDLTQPISGIQTDFGEARGLRGLSGCRVMSLGASILPVTLRVPHTFLTPGLHRVTFTVLAGDCTGALIRTVGTLDVTVAPRSSTRAASRGGSRAAAQSAATRAAGCRDKLLAPTNANRARIAAATLCLVNAERRKRGRKKLLNSPRLARAASAHSADMLRRKYFEHEWVPGGPKLAARLRKAGYRGRTFAENIGYGSTNPPQLQVRAWMNSPGHRANILHPRLKFGGVGIVIGIPVTPHRPGAIYTMNYGATLR